MIRFVVSLFLAALLLAGFLFVVPAVKQLREPVIAAEKALTVIRAAKEDLDEVRKPAAAAARPAKTIAAEPPKVPPRPAARKPPTGDGEVPAEDGLAELAEPAPEPAPAAPWPRYDPAHR